MGAGTQAGPCPRDCAMNVPGVDPDMPGNLRVAVIDDYMRIAPGAVDWSRLGHQAEVNFFHDRITGSTEIIERLQSYDVICAMRERTRFDGVLLRALPRLKLLVTTGMRNPAIDLQSAADRGILVCGTETPGVAAAEHAWALILSLMRAVPAEDQAIRQGAWQTRLGEDLSGRTLGIVGMGKLGGVVARVGEAFGMRVLSWSPDLSLGRPLPGETSHQALLALLGQSDVVSIHLVLSDISAGLIGAPEIAVMKPTAYLVNTARSRIVDNAALVDALQAGRLAGAGLDVFDEEPLPSGHPLTRLPNTVLTPHSGHITRQTVEGFYRQTLEALQAWLMGSPIRVLTSSTRAS